MELVRGADPIAGDVDPATDAAAESNPPTDRRRLLVCRGFGSRRQYVATPPAEPLGGGDW